MASNLVTREEVRKLRDLVERGFWTFDPCADPNDTQIGYCTWCFVMEGAKHEKDCRSHEIMRTLTRIEEAVDNGRL